MFLKVYVDMYISLYCHCIDGSDIYIIDYYGAHTLLYYCKRLFFLDPVKLSCKFVCDRLCNSFDMHYLQEIFLFILDSIFPLGNVGWTEGE